MAIITNIANIDYIDNIVAQVVQKYCAILKKF